MPRGERPLDSEDTELGSFAADLRGLRREAGNPTYRELSSRAHYSVATLADAAGGRKLPSLAVTLAYVGACGGDIGKWEERWRAIASPPAEAADSPYIGLAAFRTEDADRFFGREELTAKLVKLVQERSFVGVFGASGSGKSSLLRAGLVPKLERTLVFTPGALPLDECAVRLAQLMGESAAALRVEMAADPRNLGLRVRQWDPDLVLVVDQFEEVFTLADAAACEWLVKALVACPQVVIGVRADFYGHCGRHPELVAAVEGSQLLVGPMTSDELRRAITGPAQRVGAKVETALVTRLVTDVVGQPAALPLVSHALVETWRRRRGMTLSLAGYEEAGGVEHAVARTADTVFDSLSAQQQFVARQIFLRLIALGEGTDDTKRRVQRADLDDAVLDQLAAARLITLDRDHIELAHEALIRSWPRLRGWLDDNRAALHDHHRLTDAAAAWESHERDPESLYRGVRLSQARELSSDWLNAREREFLDASLAADQAARTVARRRTRRLRQFVALLVIMVLLMGAAVVVAVDAQRTAVQQRNLAATRKALQDAASIEPAPGGLAAKVSLAAHRLAPTRETADAVVNFNARVRTTDPGAEHPAEGSQMLVDLSARFGSVATSSDERLAVTTGDVVRLWDLGLTCNADVAGRVATGFVLSSHGPVPACEMATINVSATDVVLSPDSRLLAASNGATTQLWDITNPRNPAPVTEFAVDAEWAAFGPGGRVLATGSQNAPTTLWDIALPHQPQKISVLPLSTGDRDAVFSPDGLVATTNADGTLTLWDVKNLRSPRALAETTTTFPAGYRSVAFSMDGRLLVARHTERRATLWRIGEGGRLVDEVHLAATRDLSDLTFLSNRVLQGRGKGVTITWDLDLDHVSDWICWEGELTPEEWQRFFPDMPPWSVC